jgi:GNAT superfamily N-acetyltransferase
VTAILARAIVRSPRAQSVRIRPLRPSDRLNLMALDGRLSERSVYRRFFSIDRHQADVYAIHLLAHDPGGHRALVAVLDGRLVGIASYERIDQQSAEIAVLVDDAVQDHGIGTRLMQRLIIDARIAGFRTLVADVLGENRAMVRLISDTGLEATWAYEGSVQRACLQLEPVAGMARTAPATGVTR